MNADQHAARVRAFRELIGVQRQRQHDLEHLDLSHRTSKELGHHTDRRRQLANAAHKASELEDRRSWVTSPRVWQRRAEERATLTPRVQTGLDLENTPTGRADRQRAIRQRGNFATIRRAHRRRTQNVRKGVGGLER